LISISVFPSDPDETLPAAPPPRRDEGPAPISEASSFGRYRLVRELGRGGQGVVYLAEDPALGRRVALKVLTAKPAPSPGALERFRREAAVTARLEHPGLCPVYDVGAVDGTPYLAMRYVEGVTLAQILAAARLPSGGSPVTAPETFGSTDAERRLGRARPSRRDEPSSHARSRAEVFRRVAYVEKAARALHAAHEHGIVHRDVKPGNIMVAASGEVTTLDFGLAQDLEGDEATLTATGDLVGTPPYLSPEQLASQAVRLDRRTDVWSLGVVLHECATLERPFSGPTREALYRAILAEDPPDPRASNPETPDDLATVIATALEKNRDRRYATALDFAEDLRRVLAFEPILAKRAGPWVRLSRFAQRQPTLATTMALGLTLLFASLVFLREAILERDAKDAALRGKAAALDDYERLGDASRLESLESEAALLWPARPDQVDAMEAWLARADALLKNLPGHRDTLRRLRTAADSRPRFGGGADQFRHDTLAKLVDDLERFADPDPWHGAVASVRERLEFARAVRRRTLEDYAAAWNDAVASIADRAASPRYAGLVIAPQLGLIPIGRDPASGLWEFAHLATAAKGRNPVPSRGPDGRLALADDAGLVFVLLPGGAARIGAATPSVEEDEDVVGPHVDPSAQDDEIPVHDVTLAPWFLSKYEMTQAQWTRAVGSDPSTYGPGWRLGGKAVGLRHPVESVSWIDARDALARLGLALPTEAQWEHAARAGTSTPWWTGLTKETLADAENLADQFCRTNGGHPSWTFEGWDDGFAVHAPVGSFRANAFGLHDLLGNVSEWCADPYGFYDDPTRPVDGLRLSPEGRGRVNRGAAFSFIARNARCAYRSRFAPDFRDATVGVRPARALQ
jgi:serine/threonine protein kinase/formylglycine-generating enzyme required for sulfatase activity